MNRIFTRFHKNRDLFQNYLWICLQGVGKEGISLLIFIVTVAKLSAANFGTYSYVLSLIYLVAALSEFGIATAVSKYVAEYSVTDYVKCRKVVLNATLIIGICGTLFSTFLFIFGRYFFPEIYRYLLFLIPLIFLIPITALYDGAFKGLKEFKKLSLISVSSGLVSLVFIFILIEHYGIIGALIAQNVLYLILLLQLVCSYRDIDLSIDTDLIKELMSYAVLIGMVNVGYFLYTKADILILGHFGMVVEIAHYTIVEKIFMLLIIPIMWFSTVRAPDSTRASVTQEFTQIRKWLIGESLALFILGCAVSILLYFCAPFLVAHFLGKYDEVMLLSMFNVLLLLVPFRFFSNHINVGYITPIGKVKIITFTTIIFGVVNVLLDIILIKEVGYIGVVYATLISQGCSIFLSKYIFIRRLNRLCSTT